jgi:hypothetical protein
MSMGFRWTTVYKRYTRVHFAPSFSGTAATNRVQVLSVAPGTFREWGLTAVAIGTVMEGRRHEMGFYRQFESKVDLLVEAVPAWLRETMSGRRRTIFFTRREMAVRAARATGAIQHLPAPSSFRRRALGN